jgi:uncharacterized protein
MAAGNTLRVLTDFELDGEFLSAVRDGVLLIQRCGSCSSVQFYPRSVCAACQSTELAWLRSQATGSVYSMTEVHRPASRVGAQFTLLLVDLAEGPRILCRADGTATGMSIGDPVRVVPELGGPEEKLLRFIAHAGSVVEGSPS